MRWNKQGLMIRPQRNLGWMVTHAQVPFAEGFGDDLYRIYFAGRNTDNRSQIGYVEIDIRQPQKILRITEKPVVELGSLGTFDDSGVFPSWIVDHDGKKYLYYTGWMEGKRVPYYASIGLAISIDGGRTFNKFSKAPLLERIDVDPYMTNSPCVRIENGVWRMWYASCIACHIDNGKLTPHYNIKYAESKDGIEWERKGIVCIDLKSREEQVITRPCVIKDGGIYKMWYACSSGSYRIGYAESSDGIWWERKDHEVGIDVSEAGWDSEMIEYPFVFANKGKKYMLYNGNNYGKDGIGYAVMNSYD